MVYKISIIEDELLIEESGKFLSIVIKYMTLISTYRQEDAIYVFYSRWKKSQIRKRRDKCYLKHMIAVIWISAEKLWRKVSGVIA